MWEFPWISDEDMASDLADEEFLKRGSGDKKISITLPINWIEELDIFSNFKHQDPYGVGLGDEGEREHYYYVESITYNWMEDTITVLGADLSYILRQCMIIGRCSEMPDTGWPDATEWQRMFGFIADCLTDLIFDGGTVAPVVGEILTGLISRVTGRVISFTVSSGTWGGGNAAGTIHLGIVSGCFQNNENITGSIAAVLVVDGNTEPYAAFADGEPAKRLCKCCY